MSTGNPVLVVVGAGETGSAIAERQGLGRRIVLADRDETTLRCREVALRAAGHDVTGRVVDITSRDEVSDFVRFINTCGSLHQFALTVGFGLDSNDSEQVLGTHLLGVARVIESVGTVIGRGGAGVVGLGITGYLGAKFTHDQEQAVAEAWADELLQLPFLARLRYGEPCVALAAANRAVRILVAANAIRWGWRGSRLNSISCRMGSDQLPGPCSGAGDSASAAAFLLGSEARFVNGSDLRLDGGLRAAIRTRQLSLIEA